MNLSRKKTEEPKARHGKKGGIIQRGGKVYGSVLREMNVVASSAARLLPSLITPCPKQGGEGMNPALLMGFWEREIGPIQKGSW